MPTRPNPIEGGKDTEIEMEPMTPAGDKPCSFAVGRIFHEDRNVVALLLARQRLLAKEKAPKALIISNPGGGLPLLETFSRNTANEFKNAGYDTTATFGRAANKADAKRRLPEATVFLWEGHRSTLLSTYAIHQWQEPLKPSLVFLQSCLALAETTAQPFLERGALGVIGSSARTYSGSGGAFSLAFFDTLLYEDQSLGGSLRQAKNFMLAFAELKKRRFGEESKLGGANVRAAWAFTLWGDPTVKLPRPTRPDDALDLVKHVVEGNTIIVTLPSEVHDSIISEKYVAVVPANARLAGLVRKQDMADQHKLVPFTFAEVNLPNAKPGLTPKIRTKLPETHWVFCYDERCQRGYLLVTPRAKDHGELRFQLVWE
jgi:Peptidase family C25